MKKLRLKRKVKISLLLIIYIVGILSFANMYCNRISELNNARELDNYITHED